jgi:transposase, IS5 family
MRGYSTQQLSFGDGFIDPSVYELNEELTQVDKLLSNHSLLKPFEDVFDPTMGRPGTPIDVYLRMLYLKSRWGLSYEEVEAEVRERLPWRRFCNLSLMDSVPDSTTLIKLNQRFGEERIADLNKILIKDLVKSKTIKPRKIRIDSTTIESHISYPTDINLVHQVVKTLTNTAQKLGSKITNHVRSTKAALAKVGASLKIKGKNQKMQIQKTLRKITELASETVKQSKVVIKNIKSAANVKATIVAKYKEQITIAEQILNQTKQKLAGSKSIPERIVSFYDPEARSIVKGKFNRPTEFGRTMQLVQDSSGIIIDYQTHLGNPNDRPLLVPLVKKFKKNFGRAPAEIAADRGYYDSQSIITLKNIGVQHTGIPKAGRMNAKERRRQKSKWFKKLQRFRCGIEAGISMLKRQFSLGNLLVRGSPATAIKVGFAIFSYNLWQLT